LQFLNRRELDTPPFSSAFGGKPDSPKIKAATKEKESFKLKGDNETVISGQRRRQRRLGGKGVIQQFQNL
jgi:hypothetical protein